MRRLPTAMLAGCLVVASDIKVHRETLGEPPAGKFHRVGDAADLARVLVSALGEGQRMEQLGRRARERAERRFDVRRIARQHERFYADLLATRRRTAGAGS